MFLTFILSSQTYFSAINKITAWLTYLINAHGFFSASRSLYHDTQFSFAGSVSVNVKVSRVADTNTVLLHPATRHVTLLSVDRYNNHTPIILLHRSRIRCHTIYVMECLHDEANIKQLVHVYFGHLFE